jgi:hypothetical protein
MINSLTEEQAAMRQRWADPSYRWSNDSDLRKRYLKETYAALEKHKAKPNTQPSDPAREQSVGSEATTGTRQESETRTEGEPR